MKEERSHVLSEKTQKESLAWVRAIWFSGSDSNKRIDKDQNNYEGVDECQFNGCFIHHRVLSQCLILINYEAHSMPRHRAYQFVEIA